MTRRFARNATLLLCTLALAWTACGGDEKAETAAKAPAAKPADERADVAPAAPTTDKPQAQTAIPGTGAGFMPELTEVEWRLVAIEPASGDRIEPEAAAVPTLMFNGVQSADGSRRVVGFTGCNRYFSVYEVSADGRLSLPAPLAATRMACPDPIMSVESAFNDALSSATSYSIEGNELVISHPDGSLRFDRG